MRHGSLVEAAGYRGCNLTSPRKPSKIPFLPIVWWRNYYSLLPAAYTTDVKSFEFRSEKSIFALLGGENNQQTGKMHKISYFRAAL